MLNIDLADVTRALTGRKGGLRPSKPKGNGLYAYIWRMARFHSGADVTMPIMCGFDLQDYLDENGIPGRVAMLLDDAGQAITNEADAVVDKVLEALGEDPNGAARRWGALGIL